MPLTSSTGTSSWRITAFCSFWIVAVISCITLPLALERVFSKSGSSMATVVSKYEFNLSCVMSNWRRSFKLAVIVRLSTL